MNSVGIFKQSMEARNDLGIGLSPGPPGCAGRVGSLESIFGLLNSFKFGLRMVQCSIPDNSQKCTVYCTINGQH